MSTTANRSQTISRQSEIFDAGILAMMHMADEWNHEVARFMRHRVNAYSAFANDLAQCAAPSAVFLCYARFAGETWGDYAQEAVTLQAFARRATEEAALTADAVATPAKAPVLE
jgi:hypothetical protein